jgi:hypothetical protein
MYILHQLQLNRNLFQQADIFSLGAVFLLVINPLTTIQDLDRVRTGILPTNLGRSATIRLFQRMVSVEPDKRPEALQVVNDCEVILTALKNHQF